MKLKCCLVTQSFPDSYLLVNSCECFRMELMDELSGVRDALVQQMFNDTLLRRNLSAIDDADGPLPTSIKITVVVVYLIVCVVGLVGNCLVMYVIIR